MSESADKIVIELDYELASGAEEKLKKFYEGAQAKAEKIYAGPKGSGGTRKKGIVTIAPELLKKWATNENVNWRFYEGRKSSQEREKSEEGINWERWDHLSKKFANRDIGHEGYKRNKGPFGATPFSQDIYEGMTPKSRLNMKYKLALEGFNSGEMSDKDAFLTHENKKREEKLYREEEQRRKQVFRTQMLAERNRSTLFRKLMRTAGVAVAGFGSIALGKFALGKFLNVSSKASGILTKAFVTHDTPQNTQAFSAWLNDKGLNEKSAYATLAKYAQVTGIKDQPYTKIMERFLKEAQKATPKQLQAALGHGADPEFLRKVKDYSGDFSKELKAFKGEVISDEDLKKMENLGIAWGKFTRMAAKFWDSSGFSESMANGLDHTREQMEGLSKSWPKMTESFTKMAEAPFVSISTSFERIGIFGKNLLNVLNDTARLLLPTFPEKLVMPKETELEKSIFKKFQDVGELLGFGRENVNTGAANSPKTAFSKFDMPLEERLGAAGQALGGKFKTFQHQPLFDMIAEGERAPSSKFDMPLEKRLEAAKGSMTSHEDSRRIVQNNSFSFNIRSTDPEKAASESAKKIKEALMNKIFLPEGALS